MKLAFGTRPHYIISVRGNEDITLHTGSGNVNNALGPAAYTTVTNCMDDLFQRMNATEGQKQWAAVVELNRGVRGGWWVTIVQQDEENGIEHDNLSVIAMGTPVEIYNQLLPHLHMMRTTT